MQNKYKLYNLHTEVFHIYAHAPTHYARKGYSTEYSAYRQNMCSLIFSRTLSLFYSCYEGRFNTD